MICLESVGTHVCDLEAGHTGLHEDGPEGTAFLWGYENA
ncbi:hypothetical protein EDF55_0089 [Curtobacterium sp. ZW137]|nr:hypothetical protein EDF55_0089 [Curtobacterium sp. ZW137]